MQGYRDRLRVLLVFALCTFAIAEIAALIAAAVHPDTYINNPYTHNVWWLMQGISCTGMLPVPAAARAAET
jgi:hypothetical protein